MVTLVSFLLLLYSDTLLERHKNSSFDGKVVAMKALESVGWFNIGLIACIIALNSLIVAFFTIKGLIKAAKRLLSNFKARSQNQLK